MGASVAAIEWVYATAPLPNLILLQHKHLSSLINAVRRLYGRQVAETRRGRSPR